MLLALECTVLTSVVSPIRRVPHCAVWSVHLGEQLHGVHHFLRLHLEIVAIDIKHFLHPSRGRIVVGGDYGLFFLYHWLLHTTTVVVSPHVKLVAANGDEEN